MSAQTNIEWCDSTLNFWSGCTKVSAGCKNCYAETLSNRGMTDTKGHKTLGNWGHGAPRRLHESAFKLALTLNRKPWICNGCGTACAPIGEHYCTQSNGEPTFRPRRIFSLSLADWLDAEVPIGWLLRMLHTIYQCHGVDWLLLTKRPENFKSRLLLALDAITDGTGSNAKFWQWLVDWIGGVVPRGLWIGVSVEDQETANSRIPELLKIPAAQRFLSCEPLLGPVDLTKIGKFRDIDLSCLDEIVGHVERPRIDWVIIGGESGNGARRCNVEWIRFLVHQTAAAGVARFVKQLGSKPDHNLPVVCPKCHCESSQEPGDKCIRDHHGCDGIMRLQPSTLKHKKGGDMDEWPIDLRVQQWPS